MMNISALVCELSRSGKVKSLTGGTFRTTEFPPTAPASNGFSAVQGSIIHIPVLVPDLILNAMLYD